MGTVPTALTYVTGQILTASQLNGNPGATWGAFVLSGPAALLRQTSGQSIPNNVGTAVTFDAEDLDSDNGHSTVTNTSRYTAQTAGWLWVAGLVAHGSSTAGDNRGCFWAVNGVTLNASNVAIPPRGGTGATTIPAITRLIQVAAGDFVELMAIHNAGAALSTLAAGQNQCSMSVWWARTNP
jgi:hypothetical protein